MISAVPQPSAVARSPLVSSGFAVVMVPADRRQRTACPPELIRSPFERVLHEIITPGRKWASGRESF